MLKPSSRHVQQVRPVNVAHASAGMLGQAPNWLGNEYTVDLDSLCILPWLCPASCWQPMTMGVSCGTWMKMLCKVLQNQSQSVA